MRLCGFTTGCFMLCLALLFVLVFLVLFQQRSELMSNTVHYHMHWSDGPLVFFNMLKLISILWSSIMFGS